MAQGNPSSNRLGKIFAALVGLATIAAFIWQVQSSSMDKARSATVIANQAIQIAYQKTQSAIDMERNQNQSAQLTNEAQRANIEDPIRTPLPTNNPDFALTATAFIAQATQIEATRQVLATKQREIEAAQTAVSQSLSTPIIVVRADDIIPQIKGEDGGIQKVINWWSEVDYGGDSGQLDPSSPVSKHKCFGLAWNTNQYGYHRLIVFQKTTTLSFAAGGWYIKVCVPDNIVISAEDVGRIQADWLGKRYGIDNTPWRVIVIE